MSAGSYAVWMDPTIERFRALARSSPWRWSTLRYVQERDPSGRDQNLVRVFIRRPRLARVEQLDTDSVMIGNYYDLAFLDPVELTDGGDDVPGATIEDLHVVDHRGRQAWEAVLRPTADYDPLCPCCSLLLSEQLEDAGLDLREDEPDFVYPDAHRVRIDVGTGVCVYNEQLGGTRNGSGHDLAIEAVDEPMGDQLFPQHPPSHWARLLGRR